MRRSNDRPRPRRRLTFESLEPRLVLHGFAPVELSEIPEGLIGGDLLVPELHSLPGAGASLYLDFDGHRETAWRTAGGMTVDSPRFDVDGDPNSYSASEKALIEMIWRHVAEDFAPFNIDVTTVDPGGWDAPDGRVLRVLVGGSSSDWYAELYDGQSAFGTATGEGAFTNDYTNTVYVFSEDQIAELNEWVAGGVIQPQELPAYTAKWLGDTASHEAGHGFGLEHQRRFSDIGHLVEEYLTVDDPDCDAPCGKAPIMGSRHRALRSTWWLGTVAPPVMVDYGLNGREASTQLQPLAALQDDMAVIASEVNGFGYRPDDHGSDFASALRVGSSAIHVQGIIEQTTDSDYFQFTTDGGHLGVIVNVAPGRFVANLDARLELWGEDAGGALTLLAAAGDGDDHLAAGLEIDLAAGSYYLVVRSQGDYGDVGQYTLNGLIRRAGEIPLWPDSVDPPTAVRVNPDGAWPDDVRWDASFYPESAALIYDAVTYGGVNIDAAAVELPGSKAAAPAADDGTMYSNLLNEFPSFPTLTFPT